MSKVFIEETTLTSIGDAIRGKTGNTELIAPLDMATEIESIQTGGGELPPEAFVISGNCDYRFSNNGWNWFIDAYGNQITTENVTNAANMFSYSNQLKSIPFDLNFYNNTTSNASYMCGGCFNLKSIGDIKNANFMGGMSNMFAQCNNLREIPNFIDCRWDDVHSSEYVSLTQMFYQCYSLRNIPVDFLKELYTMATGYYYTFPYCAFTYCRSLDELRGFPAQNATVTSNMFYNTFDLCTRLKDMVFTIQEDNTPYIRTWSNQTIDLSNRIGYSDIISGITNFGITADKEVTDNTTYQALKNDADWFTCDINYSRYNHDSAVNTINSLPDCSSGSSNTIKFKGAAGALTDGGAINTLTSEEIAVAAAKGWTVSLV